MHGEGQEWKTVKETAEALKIPLTRCYELIHAGALPAVRIGERSIRVPARELEQVLLAQHRVAEWIPGQERSSREEFGRVADLVQDDAANTPRSRSRRKSTK